MYLLFWAAVAALLLFQLRRVWGTSAGFQPGRPAGQKEERPREDHSSSSLMDSFDKQLKAWGASFDAVSLMKKCEEMFRELLEAFAASHHATLKKHMSKDVYESFALQMERREQKGVSLRLEVRNLQTTLQNLRKTSQGIEAEVVFRSEQMSMTVNAQGESFDNPSQIFVPKVDTWVFVCKREALTVVETASKKGT